MRRRPGSRLRTRRVSLPQVLFQYSRALAQRDLGPRFIGRPRKSNVGSPLYRKLYGSRVGNRDDRKALDPKDEAAQGG